MKTEVTMLTCHGKSLSNFFCQAEYGIRDIGVTGVQTCALPILPPSESKAPGGDGDPLDLATLSWPKLTDVRAGLAEALVELAGDPPAARAALGLSPTQDDEVARNAELLGAPTTPTLERYTGVLYDALDVRSLTRAQRARADRRLAVGSALFGVVRGTDRIPAYRLSAGSALPGLPTLRTLWRAGLGPVLAGGGEPGGGIGRASCRERVEILGVAVSVKKK